MLNLDHKEVEKTIAAFGPRQEQAQELVGIGNAAQAEMRETTSSEKIERAMTETQDIMTSALQFAQGEREKGVDELMHTQFNLEGDLKVAAKDVKDSLGAIGSSSEGDLQNLVAPIFHAEECF